MTKIIAFSLWGDNPKYTKGALRNAELARTIYPGWTCRFYLGEHGPSSAEDYARLAENPLIQCRQIPESMDGWKGMFARFLPATEEDVEVFISRDCDSRLTERESFAVNQWLDSSFLMHVMRDHPFHTSPIMGGMWGAKRYAMPDFGELLNGWIGEDRWQTDQEFLRDIIWPIYHHKVMVHDNWRRFEPFGRIVPFPTPRVNGEFVGSVIGPDDERVHLEHHDMVRNLT